MRVDGGLDVHTTFCGKPAAAKAEAVQHGLREATSKRALRSTSRRRLALCSRPCNTKSRSLRDCRSYVSGQSVNIWDLKQYVGRDRFGVTPGAASVSAQSCALSIMPSWHCDKHFSPYTPPGRCSRCVGISSTCCSSASAIVRSTSVTSTVAPLVWVLLASNE